jgi:hypothetical protein
MGLTEVDIKNIVKEAVREVVKEEASKHVCALEAVGVSDEVHCQHHLFLEGLLADRQAIKRAFFIGVITTVTGGILGLLWWGFKNSPAKLPPF